jgi:hypothetical protein
LSPEEIDFTEGLAGFAKQFRAQVDAAGPPASEHAVHFCLALGFQAAYDLPPGSVVFERPTGERKRIDLWFAPPLNLSIEVKFSRPMPSGQNRPFTQIYGSFLADLNKVLIAPSAHRMVVLVADVQTLNHMKGKGGGELLPWRMGAVVRIGPEDIARLPETARRNAVADGPWSSLSAHMTWSDTVDLAFLAAWTVTPG